VLEEPEGTTRKDVVQEDFGVELGVTHGSQLVVGHGVDVEVRIGGLGRKVAGMERSAVIDASSVQVVSML
jgi:hypothetical protein